jgi:hypothetical protein
MSPKNKNEQHFTLFVDFCSHLVLSIPTIQQSNKSKKPTLLWLRAKVE